MASSQVDVMDPAKEREIIRLWNRLRLLEREGRPVESVRRQIEKGLGRARASCGLIMSDPSLFGSRFKAIEREKGVSSVISTSTTRCYGLPLLCDAAVERIDLLFETLFNHTSLDLEGGRQASVLDRPWEWCGEDCANLADWGQAARLRRDAREDRIRRPGHVEVGLIDLKITRKQ